MTGESLRTGEGSVDSESTGQGQIHLSDEFKAGSIQASRNRKLLGVLCILLVVFGGVFHCNRRNPICRDFVIQCLGMIGPSTAPTLVEMISDEGDLRASGTAIVELYKMKDAAAPALIDALLSETNPRKRPLLFYALNTVGVKKVDVCRVVEATCNSEPGVRFLAVQTLPSICGHEVAVPSLTKALEDADIAVQIEAVKALALYGPSASAALPVLQSLKLSSNKTLQAIASEAVEVIQGHQSNVFLPSLPIRHIKNPS